MTTAPKVNGCPGTGLPVRARNQWAPVSYRRPASPRLWSALDNLGRGPVLVDADLDNLVGPPFDVLGLLLTLDMVAGDVSDKTQHDRSVVVDHVVLGVPEDVPVKITGTPASGVGDGAGEQFSHSGASIDVLRRGGLW